MNVKVFQYLKENSYKDYEVFVIKNESEYIEGISVSSLSKEDKERIHKIFKEFEEKLKPYMANWRRFKKSLIVKTHSDTSI